MLFEAIFLILFFGISKLLVFFFLETSPLPLKFAFDASSSISSVMVKSREFAGFKGIAAFSTFLSNLNC